MKKISSLILIAICLILQSCASADYALDAQRNAMSSKNANREETNIGLDGVDQFLYSPMYLFHGAMSAMAIPYKPFYKNEFKKLEKDFDYEVFLNKDSARALLIMPQCKNNLIAFAIGFVGKENALDNYEVRKEDIYLKEGNEIINPTVIYLAGTKFEKITSKAVEVSYPIFRKKNIAYRFVEFPCYCENLEESSIDLVIAKIYRGREVVKEKTILSNFSLYNPRVTPNGSNGTIVNLDK